MLHVGCSACANVVPLFCAGQIFLHPPTAALATAFGVACPFCGVVPPVFTCLSCFTTQLFFVPTGVPGGGPSARPPPMLNALLAQRMPVAPVVDAPSGARGDFVKGLIKETATSFATNFGKTLANQLFGAFTGS